MRADSGNVIWTDGLGLALGQAGVVEFLAIRGEPVISNNQVFATGLGGVTIAADLLTGRRVWERRVASENTPCLAGDWMFLISTDQEIGAINTNDCPDFLGCHAAAVGEPGQEEGPDHLVRPGSGRQPADRGGHQPDGARTRSDDRSDPVLLTACPTWPPR